MNNKKYGSYTEEDINDWQTLPAVAPILTSSQFGAWLMRRDERKLKREVKTELEKIKAEIDGLYSDFLYGEQLVSKTNTMQILDNHIKEK